MSFFLFKNRFASAFPVSFCAVVDRDSCSMLTCVAVDRPGPLRRALRQGGPALEPINLRCEYRVNPLGIDVDRSRA